MTTVHRTFDRSIERVFAVLADPRTYPEWLVGAKETRAVDVGWPAPGTSFHHRVGIVGPLTVADRTTSIAVDSPVLLEVEACARPVGRARVTFRLTAMSPTATEVEFSEEPIGPARVISPLAAVLSIPRNKRSLQNLERFLEADRR